MALDPIYPTNLVPGLESYFSLVTQNLISLKYDFVICAGALHKFLFPVELARGIQIKPR